MRQWQKVIYSTVGLAVVLLLLSWATLAHAQSFHTGSNVTVGNNQTINSSLYTSGRTIDITGTVNGDVFCAGQNVTISGTVNGDIICAGQTVDVNGIVHGNIRVASQDFTLTAPVSGNLSVVAQNVTTQSGGDVRGDVSIAAQAAIVNGSVGRDLVVGAHNVTLNGQVSRNVVAQDARLTLDANTHIKGNLTYTSQTSFSRNHSAIVDGTIVQRLVSSQSHFHPGGLVGKTALLLLYLFVTTLLFALILVLLIPSVFHKASQTASRQYLKTFLVGFLASFAMPVVIIGLLLTVVGIPPALFVALVWLVFVVASWPFAAYLLGRTILKSSTDNVILTMLVGSVVLLVLYLIPVIGIVVILVAFWFGLGTMLLQVAKLPKPRYDMK